MITGESVGVRKCCSRPVSRILSAIRRPCGRRRRDDHSSSPGITDGVQQPTRRLRTSRPRTSPYLVLLRVGFCVPRLSPAARCALTAPFHPYPSTRDAFGLRSLEGGIFSVPLSVGSPRPGVTQHTALWSSDFPLPQHFVRRCRSRRDGYSRQRSSGRLQHLIIPRMSATMRAAIPRRTSRHGAS